MTHQNFWAKWDCQNWYRRKLVDVRGKSLTLDVHGDPTGWPAACESLTDPGAVPDGLRARACAVPERHMCHRTGSLAPKKPNRVSLDGEDNLACCSGSLWECWSRNIRWRRKKKKVEHDHYMGFHVISVLCRYRKSRENNNKEVFR